MIIVSQDKKEIINFDNLVSIYVIESYEAKEKGVKKYNIYFATTDEINFVIGTYETEERAKEVLIGIMQSYLDSENYKYVNQLMTAQELDRLQDGLVYEMPKE